MLTSALRSSKRIKNRVESVLPDDIVTDILLRVPVKDVLRCRCVCIRWKNLTSSQNFMDLHSRRSVPIILAEDRYGQKLQFNRVLFDKWWEHTRTRSVIHKFKSCPECRIYLSQAGFVVFRYLNSVQSSSVDFIVRNPVYREEVRIVIPRRFWAEVYGIFFHPNLNEYCILFGVSLLPNSKLVQYKLLNLGSEPCWRGLSSPRCHRPKFVLSCSVFIDEYLYWIVLFEKGVDNGRYDVMEFDTRSEEFRLMPCPIPETLEGCHCHFNVNLLNIDGLLSLVRISLEGKPVVISIWTLKDRVEQLWMSSNYIIKNEGYSGGITQALAVVDKELVVRSHKKLFVSNLELGINRNFGKKNYNYGPQFLPHVMTLASLKNCKTKIYLEQTDWEDAKTKKCLVSGSLDRKKDSSS